MWVERFRKEFEQFANGIVLLAVAGISVVMTERRKHLLQGLFRRTIVRAIKEAVEEIFLPGDKVGPPRPIVAFRDSPQPSPDDVVSI